MIVPRIPSQAIPLILFATLNLAAALPHDAYIWQRVWGDDLRDALESTSSNIRGYTCLAAEITPSPEGDAIVLIDLDHAALKRTARPVTLAIRVGPYPGPFGERATTTQNLLLVTREAMARAGRHGLPVAALEIDFDAATSKLEGYREWLRLLREEYPRVPLSITTLPTWMSRPAEFGSIPGEPGANLVS